ncbi:MAG: RDD family protein [Lentisphaerae bacterium]|nr:RDD family protein [Lentisphaerota bacterium]
MWYYAVGGQQQGPVSLDALQAMFRSGQLDADSLVWREGMAEWAAAGTVAELQLTIGAQAAAANSADASLPPLRPLPTETAAATPELRACCSQCGQGFSSVDLIDYQGQLVCPHCKDAFFQRLREGLRVQGGDFEYAGFWIRALAMMIDNGILAIVQSVLALPLNIGSAASGFLDESVGTAVAVVTSLVSMSVQIAVYIFYNGFFLSRYAATPGKMALGLKVLRSDGSRLTFWRGVCRWLASGLSGLILCIGYLMVLFDDEKRALHDHICDTRVVR